MRSLSTGNLGRARITSGSPAITVGTAMPMSGRRDVGRSRPSRTRNGLLQSGITAKTAMYFPKAIGGENGHGVLRGNGQVYGLPILLYLFESARIMRTGRHAPGFLGSQRLTLWRRTLDLE